MQIICHLSYCFCTGPSQPIQIDPAVNAHSMRASALFATGTGLLYHVNWDLGMNTKQVSPSYDHEEIWGQRVSGWSWGSWWEVVCCVKGYYVITWSPVLLGTTSKRHLVLILSVFFSRAFCPLDSKTKCNYNTFSFKFTMRTFLHWVHWKN